MSYKKQSRFVPCRLAKTKKIFLEGIKNDAEWSNHDFWYKVLSAYPIARFIIVSTRSRAIVFCSKIFQKTKIILFMDRLRNNHLTNITELFYMGFIIHLSTSIISDDCLPCAVTTWISYSCLFIVYCWGKAKSVQTLIFFIFTRMQFFCIFLVNFFTSM